jgi:protein TonB
VFTRLPESNAQSQRRLGGLTVSTVLHLVVIALAVRATAWTAPRHEPVTVEPVVFVAPVPKPATPAAPMTPRAPSSSAPGPTSIAAPPAIGPIAVIPTEIPPAGSMSDLIRPDDFRPTAARIAGDATPPGRTGVADGSPFTERLVDRAVVALPGTAAPRYPSSLQSAGLEGDVRAQFVVDTLGRVERGTVRILESTHELFSQAVRDALARSRFSPAEAGGRKVRQLVEQSFTFRIDPRR